MSLLLTFSLLLLAERGAAQYCAAGAITTTFEKISNVTFNTINNNSSGNGTNGYQDFTSISTTVEQGSTYTFTASISIPTSTDEIIVWIDFNHDNDFSDWDEEVFNSPLGQGPHSGPLLIPTYVLLGSARMRVRLHDANPNASPNATPCGNSGYGQVEDYTIVISECSLFGAPGPGNTISSVTPPTCGSFTLSLQNSLPPATLYQWQSSPDNVNYTNITGATSPTRTVTGITTPTWYQCMTTNCGGINLSNPIQMTPVLPLASNTVTNINPPTCASFTLSLPTAQPSGTTYQWQYSSNNSTWDNFSGATNSTYTATMSVPTLWYRCRMTNCGGSVNSSALLMTGVLPIATATLSNPTPPICATYEGFTLSLQNSQPSGATYQWQVEVTPNAYANIPGATSSTYVTSGINSTKKYRCRITTCADFIFSTPITMTTQACYCPAGATNAVDEKIALVTFNTINNSSSSTAGYEDFTSISTDLWQGTSYAFTGTISNPDAADEIIAWIDFNQDMDFEDAGEKVFDSPTGVGPHTGNITVPANANPGTTRMRVRLHNTSTGSNNTACGNSTYGQVEDYAVNILACSIPNPGNTISSMTPPVCPNTAFTLSLQNSQPSGTTYQWQSSPDNSTWTSISGATNATYASTGIATATWFRCQVSWCTTVNSNPLQVTVSSAPNPGNTISSVTPPVCPGTAFTLSLQNSQPSGTTHQWQSSPDNSTWTSISGATSATYASTGITSSTWFRCQVILCSTVNSTALQMTVSTAPNPGNTISSAGPPVCSSSAFTLSLQNSQPSGTTYQWQSSPDNSTWTDISGASSATYASAGITGAVWFRCRATLCNVTTNSTALQMTVIMAPNPGNTISSVVPPACPGAAFTLSLQNSQPSGTTYQWQSSPNNSTWTDISGATSATYASPGINSTTWFRCQTTHCSTTNSTALQMTVQTCFCTAGANTQDASKTSNVSFNTINNPSSSSAGYEDFTAVSTSVEQGLTYAFTAIQPNNWPYLEIIVWIDFNQDVDFEDAGEEVLNTNTGIGPFTGNIAIPSSATLGTTRMRVRLNDTAYGGSNTTPCGNSENGQVEDYTVNIVTCVGTPDPGNTISSLGLPVCPSTAFTLSLQNSQPSGTTYQWQTSPNNSTWTNISGATSATYLSTGITTATWYRCQVIRCSTVSSSALQVTVAPTPNPGSTVSSVGLPVCPSTAFTLSLQNSQPSGTTYQWQSSPNNSTWTDISGATSATYASTGITTTWYRCRATLCSTTTNSTALQVTVATNPNPGNTVSSVGLPVCPSTAFTLSLQTSQPSGTTYQWQSSPNNSTWTDISGATSSTYPSTGITTATWYRCRATLCSVSTNSTALQMTVASTPNPGSTISSVAPPVCAGDEAFVLSLQNSQQTGTTYQWQSSPNNSTWTNISGATSATRSVTSISTSTWYRCQATKCGVTVASTPLQMTTESCYCTAGATNTQSQYEKIALITFNTINNASSSTAGYEDFTAFSTSLEQGGSYVFTTTTSNSYVDDEMIVWIDFNHDLDFNDAGEKVFDSPTGTGPYAGNITIPTNAPTGTTRMRVRLHDTAHGPNTTPCGTSTYGQVEDYTVEITLPSSYRTWIGGTGNWDMAANWNPSIIPASDNTVIISTGAPTIPASYNAAAKEISISNSADLIIANGATLTVPGATTHAIWVQGTGSSLQNSGTVTVTGSGPNTHGIYVTGASLINTGYINVPYSANIGLAGIYNSGGSLSNQVGGTISIDRGVSTYAGLATVGGGTFTNGGIVNIGTNANAVLDARGINISGTNTNGTNAATGIITIARCGSGWSGFSVESNAVFNNNGTMDVGVGGNIPGDGISATSTFQNNGTVTIANVSDKLIEGNSTQNFFNNSGGTLKGTGTILASTFRNNGGTLSPGYSPGLLSFDASKTLIASEIEVEVNGPGMAGIDYDQIAVNGTATLGGSSTLNLSINFTPSGNQQIVILNATALSGTFAIVNGLTSGWSILYDTPNTGDVSLNFALLPIELMYFKGKADGPVNQLEWATASELNSQYHAVERSADGISNWQEIGRRNAAGTSNEQHTYQLLDEQPLAVGYYRLKAVDFDGHYEYSNLVVIERETKGFDITSLFPNPTSGVLNLRVAVPEPVPVLISIYDAFGCLVQQVQTAEAKEGVNDFSVNVAQLPAGLYFVKIANKDSSSVRYFVKQ